MSKQQPRRFAAVRYFDSCETLALVSFENLRSPRENGVKHRFLELRFWGRVTPLTWRIKVLFQKLGASHESYLVDPASSHTLVLRIYPCMSKCSVS